MAGPGIIGGNQPGPPAAAGGGPGRLGHSPCQDRRRAHRRRSAPRPGTFRHRVRRPAGPGTRAPTGCSRLWPADGALEPCDRRHRARAGGPRGTGQKLGLASRIRWRGRPSRAQVQALWGQVDCLVVPSRSTPSGSSAMGAGAGRGDGPRGRAALSPPRARSPKWSGTPASWHIPRRSCWSPCRNWWSTPERRIALGHAAAAVSSTGSSMRRSPAADAFWREVITRTKPSSVPVTA